MHLRLRRSKKDPSKQDLFRVHPAGYDFHDDVMQTLWDDEQKAQLEFDPVNNPQTPLHVQRRACSRNSSNFVVEFREVGHRYTYSMTNGIAQWSFEPIMPNRQYHYRQNWFLPVALKSHQHKFFSEELICLDRNTIDNLAALFAGRNTGWFCNDEVGHDHYLIRLYLDLDTKRQDLDELDMKHTMHMVCGNAMIADIFRGLCGNKLKDRFCLTQIYWDETPHLTENMILGISYTYCAAMAGNTMVKDLGWNIGKDNAV